MALLFVPVCLLLSISYVRSVPTFEQIGCQSNEICVDLNTNNGVINLGNGVSVWNPVTDLVSNIPCSRQAVFKATFDKLPADADYLCHENNPYGGRQMLKIQLYLSDVARTDWLWDFGDSFSNNGYAGDGGHTDYAAEIQGLWSSINVYANNVYAKECTAQLLYNFPNATVMETHKVEIRIANHFLMIETNGGLKTSHCDKCLYGLNGQYSRGATNQDIYLAVNRVIDGNYRMGYGVCYMKMSWQ